MNRLAPAVLSVILALPAFAGAPGADPRTFKGTVQESLDAGSYTYLLIKTADGEAWAAVDKTSLKKGDGAEVEESAVMENFESPLLKRKFDKVVFGVLKGAPQAPGHAAMGQAAAPPALPPAVPTASEAALPRDSARSAAVSKPKGPAVTVTVAELHKRRKQLAGKRVRVTGKLVKANANILGRNWFHLKDGSGSAKTADDDLTLTTTGTGSVGSEVTAEGVVAADKDLGSGYAYKVILEDAEFATAPMK
ncbi:MAG: nucleotide-binding protein [Elusimicrobia bacterium]|nr:nucleotide-binding protein [Elusimicrobiota bacterium]